MERELVSTDAYYDWMIGPICMEPWSSSGWSPVFRFRNEPSEVLYIKVHSRADLGSKNISRVLEKNSRISV